MKEKFQIIVKDDQSTLHYENQASRMIKPSGVQLITMYTEGSITKKMQEAFQQKKMSRKGMGYLL